MISCEYNVVIVLLKCAIARYRAEIMLDMMKVQEEMRQAGACTSAQINGLTDRVSDQNDG